MVAQPFASQPNKTWEDMQARDLLRKVGRYANQALDPKTSVRAAAKRIGVDLDKGTDPVDGDSNSDSSPPPTPAVSTAQPTGPRSPAFDHYTDPGELTSLGVLFMPLAAYHGRELGAIADALRDLGYPSTFLVEEESVDAVDPHLGDHPRILASTVGFNRSALGEFDSFVAMNDWGPPSRAIYHLARVRAVPSFAKVEGVQDFTDVDTGRIRLPYLAADHVLVQGPNDIESLERKNLHIVGNANMERAWQAGPNTAARNGKVIINSNFTYGVLTDKREMFLTQAVDGIRAAGLEPVISQHPADRPLPAPFGELVTASSMSDLLPVCEAVVTRFSTVPFEAIAYGTPFVYFNPHHEKVPTFATPDPAFRHVHNATDLTAALQHAVDGRPTYREVAEPYFRAQIDMTETASAIRSAQAIASVTYGE